MSAALWLLFGVQVGEGLWLFWQEMRLRRTEQVANFGFSMAATGAMHSLFSGKRPAASGERPSDGAALSGAAAAPPRAAGGETP